MCSPNFSTGRAHTSKGVLPPILTTHRAFAIGVVFSAVFVGSGGTHNECGLSEADTRYPEIRKDHKRRFANGRPSSGGCDQLAHACHKCWGPSTREIAASGQLSLGR